MAALEGGLGLAGRGRPALWAAPRSLAPPHPGEQGPAQPGGMEEPAAPVRGGPRRKHKMDEAPDGCPAGKKRRAGRGLSPPPPAAGQWLACAGQAAGGGLAEPCAGSLPAPPGVLETPCEEMEQAAGEQQCEAARRKLQEIEDRITDEDEDEEGLVEEPAGNLPTLVLSDTLKTGLKRDYAGDLTKKIIESMSRPSMELVVWKPLPEFLTKKAKSVSVKDYKPVAETCPTESATLEDAFILRTRKFSESQQTEMPSPFYSAVEPAGCSEEEMEL